MNGPSFLPAETSPPRLRPVMMLAALAVTLVLLGLALGLGDWAFHARSGSLHQRRLEKLLTQKPDLDRVAAGLRDEGMEPAGVVHGGRELSGLASRFAGARRADVLDQGARWPTTAVFVGANVVYYLYFDDQQRLRGFTFVTR